MTSGGTGVTMSYRPTGEMPRCTLGLRWPKRTGTFLVMNAIGAARLHKSYSISTGTVHCDHALEICRERRAHLFTVHILSCCRRFWV